MARVALRQLRASSPLTALVLLLVLAGGSWAPARAADVPAKGTEILWDRYGIPHIFAPDHASLFYAYGYAQMEAHAELLVRLYAQARGRGAEFYGERYLAEVRGTLVQRHLGADLVGARRRPDLADPPARKRELEVADEGPAGQDERACRANVPLCASPVRGGEHLFGRQVRNVELAPERLGARGRKLQ